MSGDEFATMIAISTANQKRLGLPAPFQTGEERDACFKVIMIVVIMFMAMMKVMLLVKVTVMVLVRMMVISGTPDSRLVNLFWRASVIFYRQWTRTVTAPSHTMSGSDSSWRYKIRSTDFLQSQSISIKRTWSHPIQPTPINLNPSQSIQIQSTPIHPTILIWHFIDLQDIISPVAAL